MKSKQSGVITLVFVLACALVGNGVFQTGVVAGQQQAAQSQPKKSSEVVTSPLSSAAPNTGAKQPAKVASTQ